MHKSHRMLGRRWVLAAAWGWRAACLPRMRR